MVSLSSKLLEERDPLAIWYIYKSKPTI